MFWVAQFKVTSGATTPGLAAPAWLEHLWKKSKELLGIEV